MRKEHKERGWKGKMLRRILSAAHSLLRIFHVSSRSLYLKAFHYADQYNHTETRRFNYIFDPNRYICIFDKSVFYPTKRAVFEGVEISIPNRLEAYLSQRYPDYMTLPPEEKRHTHPPCELDFGPYGADPEEV